MSIDYEVVFQWIGMAMAFAASIYSFKFGNKLASFLFMTFMLLQAQIIFLIQVIGYPEDMGACWATGKGGYYACLPFFYKLAFHSAQAGNYILALAIIVSLKDRKNVISNP